MQKKSAGTVLIKWFVPGITLAEQDFEDLLDSFLLGLGAFV